MTALPSSQELTIEAKRRVHSDSCAEEASGARLAMTKDLPSPDKQGCNSTNNVSLQLRWYLFVLLYS